MRKHACTVPGFDCDACENAPLSSPPEVSMVDWWLELLPTESLYKKKWGSLMGYFCSGLSINSVEIFLEFDCSQRLFWPNPHLSIFSSGVRPVLWSEGSSHFLQIPPLHLSQAIFFYNKCLAHNYKQSAAVASASQSVSSDIDFGGGISIIWYQMCSLWSIIGCSGVAIE